MDECNTVGDLPESCDNSWYVLNVLPFLFCYETTANYKIVQRKSEFTILVLAGIAQITTF